MCVHNEIEPNYTLHHIPAYTCMHVCTHTTLDTHTHTHARTHTHMYTDTDTQTHTHTHCTYHTHTHTHCTYYTHTLHIPHTHMHTHYTHAYTHNTTHTLPYTTTLDYIILHYTHMHCTQTLQTCMHACTHTPHNTIVQYTVHFTTCLQTHFQMFIHTLESNDEKIAELLLLVCEDVCCTDESLNLLESEIPTTVVHNTTFNIATCTYADSDTYMYLKMVWLPGIFSATHGTPVSGKNTISALII